MPTIEPEIQECILQILPDDYDVAVEVMCQLLANIMLSGDKGTPLSTIVEKLKIHVDAYEGA